MSLSPTAWVTHATKDPGSWWNDWINFLKKYFGPETEKISQDTVQKLALYKAPGKYVHAK